MLLLKVLSPNRALPLLQFIASVIPIQTVDVIFVTKNILLSTRSKIDLKHLFINWIACLIFLPFPSIIT